MCTGWTDHYNCADCERRYRSVYYLEDCGREECPLKERARYLWALCPECLKKEREKLAKEDSKEFTRLKKQE